MEIIERIIIENERKNGGHHNCDLSNFASLCHRIQKSLQLNDYKSAIEDMDTLTHIFKEVASLDSKYNMLVNRSNVYDIQVTIPKTVTNVRTVIENDFNFTKKEITDAFLQKLHDGAFEVTEEVLKLPNWLVDWEYYNANTERFVSICRKTDAKFGLEPTNTNYEQAYRNEYNALDVYFSRYNQRAYIKFANITDSIRAVGEYETEYAEINEEDGTLWVDVPFRS